jgi:glutamate racemase
LTKSSPDHERERSRRPIGVFDSGLGGLRVLDRLMQTLPDEHFVYLGDTLHMPYGEKTPEQLDEYVSGCLDWLFSQYRVKMVVVACNTASTAAAHLLRPLQDAGIPIVDPVTPICRWLASERRYHRVGVMATRATVASNRYRALLDRMGGEDIELVQEACGNLATVIEEGRGDTPECDAMIREYLKPLLATHVEAIILGCTHYPYVMDQIATHAPGVDILDPAVFMALEAKRLLAEQQLATPIQTAREIAEVDYFVTAEPDRFYETSRRMPFQALAMKQPVVVSVKSCLPT